MSKVPFILLIITLGYHSIYSQIEKPNVILLANVNKDNGIDSTRSSKIEIPNDYNLIWNDEFNSGASPNNENWSFEYGFVRNEELQWYQKDNAYLKNGVLVLEGRKEIIVNPNYNSANHSWKTARKHAEYTSASINTKNKFSFKYGIIEVRAKIDTSKGMWPAIWTLGVSKKWPANGEIDLMEFYIHEGKQKLLANAAWANAKMEAVWDSEKIPFQTFLESEADWSAKFHIWKMDWTEEFIKLYIDGILINEIDLKTTLNPDGFNPFHQEHYILLNLAIGSNGGDPSTTLFPKKYEIDYVRVFQKAP